MTSPKAREMLATQVRLFGDRSESDAVSSDDDDEDEESDEVEKPA